MFRDISAPALYMGILAALTGFAASFAIVLAGLTAVGATPSQAATGLLFASLAMGVCSIWLPARTRIPAAVAWSTPGAAFLATSTALPGGFAEAVGALIGCAALLLLTGAVPALGRLVAGIPKPLANALLAGVLLKLCLAPAVAAAVMPALALPIVAAWAIGLAWTRLAAMPAAVIAFVLVIALSFDATAPMAPPALPTLQVVPPVFTLQAFISLSVPLYLVTMAGQNIPGFAVLELNGYAVQRPPLLRATGAVSLAVAPFGSVPVNMSAITAAMMAGDDAGPDPGRRYWAAITSGIVYVGLAASAGLVATLVSLAPTPLITAVAGLALIPALASALTAALDHPTQREAPAITFLVAASGITLLGISGAFWGIVAGAALWYAKHLSARP